MRCLVVADLHYSLPQFDWLLSAAPHFDLVIFAGDALDVGSFVDFRAQIVVVRKYLTLLSGVTRVILCSGNHDVDERSAEGEKISRWIGEVRELGVACDGDSLTIGDTLFRVCPWWDGPLVKQRIDSQLREAAAARLKRWIWVHHAPPANSPTSWGGKRFFGDVELAQWIQSYQPSMVISGHVHQSPFIPDGSWFDRLGEIGVGDIEPLRQHPRDQNSHRRLLAQKRGGIIDFVNDRLRSGAHRRGVRLVQENRHFSEHRARLGDGGDDGIAFDDLKPSLD